MSVDSIGIYGNFVPPMPEEPINEALGERDETVPGPKWLRVVRDHVQSLRFGTVVVTVHDGRVVQVERTEKLRFEHDAGDHGKKPTDTTGGRPSQRGDLNHTHGGKP
ncbi:MAG TPA: YezD family protein [Candidatus Limnocylindria bacterium]|jgi:hypothetical protein|nr:YezD family protein [Candidatus Limnocylindria bacterium]